MRPSLIPEILDLALTIRNQKKNFIPIFIGHSGIGKSYNIKKWVFKQKEKNPNFIFKDIRLGYFEGPDLVGNPHVVCDDKGNYRTVLSLPELWPTSGEGLILLEEPNRAPLATLNCVMQLLTDRKIHEYGLPEGIIIAVAINPDLDIYSVNTMDAALTNRLCAKYPIDFDKKDFVNFIEKDGWNRPLISFIKNIWEYELPKIDEDSVYVSPRNWELINTLEQSGIDKKSDTFNISCINILGEHVGSLYYSYCQSNKEEERAVLYQDIVDNPEKATMAIKKHSSLKKIRLDLLNITVKSILQNYNNMDEEILIKVAENLPSDLAVSMLTDFCDEKYKNSAPTYLNNMLKRLPNILTDIHNIHKGEK